MLTQALYRGYHIGEISCPARYFEDASSINFRRSVIYGLGVLRTSWQCVLHRRGWRRYPIFSTKGRRLEVPSESSSKNGA
jgi:hypothetical protein